MNYQTHNDAEFWAGGSGQGRITADYATMKKLFGLPNKSDEYKSDAEWNLEFEDGTMVSIYNWKSGKNYLGASGTPKTQITDWHIGGESYKAVTLAEEAIAGLHTRKKLRPDPEPTELEIKITGSGTAAELVASLRQIANDLEVGNHVNSLRDNGEVEWEDPSLMTTISEA